MGSCLHGEPGQEPSIDKNIRFMLGQNLRTVHSMKATYKKRMAIKAEI